MADLSIDERDPNYFYAARQQKRYSIMRHTRFLETEEPLATVIVTYDNGETWHDICTCNTDYADDIADALNMANGH